MQLMLKDIPVMDIADTESGFIVKKIREPELLPVFLLNNCLTNTVNEWFKKRIIPQNREGYDDVKKRYGKAWCDNKNYASLTDQYWLRKRDEKWKKINFFTRYYSPDVGDAFFTPWKISDIRSSDSPDLTTGGVLRKRWKQDKKTLRSRLVKAGSRAAKQEPLYEVLVSVLCEKLNINAVNSELCVEGYKVCSCSDNFIDEHTELVTASDIYFSEQRDPDTSVEAHLLNMCEKFRIPGAEQHIKDVTFIDTVSGNTDRNLSNIGFVRNVDTFEFIGPAPIFDSGNAYWNISRIKGTKNSELFSETEQDVFMEYAKKYDIENIVKDRSYEEMILTYPALQGAEKQKLIDAISARNKELLGSC